MENKNRIENFEEETILTKRPMLNRVNDNAYTWQTIAKLLCVEPPDDRSLIWIPDFLGGTAKTSTFQFELGSNPSETTYIKITDGIERLLSKVIKRIQYRLETHGKYLRNVWINFGRTVTEETLKAFADVGESILDGILDENFANTGSRSFHVILYMNLIVTANVPPPLDMLSGDRWKILAPVGVWERKLSGELDTRYETIFDKFVDVLLLPVKVYTHVLLEPEIRDLCCALQQKLEILSTDEIERLYKSISYYEQLKNSVSLYEQCLTIGTRQTSKLYSKWHTKKVYNLSSQELHLYNMVRSNMKYFTAPNGLRYYERTSMSATDLRYWLDQDKTKKSFISLNPYKDKKINFKLEKINDQPGLN